MLRSMGWQEIKQRRLAIYLFGISISSGVKVIHEHLNCPSQCCDLCIESWLIKCCRNPLGQKRGLWGYTSKLRGYEIIPAHGPIVQLGWGELPTRTSHQYSGILSSSCLSTPKQYNFRAENSSQVEKIIALISISPRCVNETQELTYPQSPGQDDKWGSYSQAVLSPLTPNPGGSTDSPW